MGNKNSFILQINIQWLEQNKLLENLQELKPQENN
jgi:hypothetical protein